MGINSIVTKIFGSKADRDLKAVQPYVDKVLEKEPEIIALSNDELRQRSILLKQKIKEHIKQDEEEIISLKTKAQELNIYEREEIYAQIDVLEKDIDKKLEDFLEEILPEAFAIVKDTARRFKENEEIVVTALDFDKELAPNHDFVDIKGDKAIWYNKWIAGGNETTWDMVHYDVQIFGGIVLHRGAIAEMATGEGKTLVATLPVFLNALTGRGVHIVTVNDYLAKRDAEWMGPIFQFHGLSIDCIDKHQPNSPERRAAYLCDITYGTNNEFGFDYLRDNMAISTEDLVQRRHHYSIVDEVDSVLIDDARTPLIISGPTPRGDDQLFEDYKPQVQKLVTAQRNLITQIFSEAKKLISNGNDKDGGFKLLQAHKGLPRNKPLIKFLSEEGMRVLLQKTENQYMAENSKHMHLVTDELFFVIDEKNNSIELTDKGIDLLSANTEDKNFFVMPDIGSVIAEIEKDTSLDEHKKLKKKENLIRDYSIKSERVHTVNQLLKAYTLFEKDIEYVVIENKVKIVDEQTGRIMEGRRYSDGLHQAIEAKESVKVEAATQTYATITLQNYFRMYHKLSGMTGTAETEAGEFWDIYKLDVVVIPTNRPIVRNDFEDMVYKTKREKYNAVIGNILDLVNQGRPVLVGTTSVEISELLSRMLKLKGIKHNVLNAKLHKKEADIVAEAGRSKTVTIATNMAGRGTDIKLSKEVKEAGGLAIVGTERHDSRRVDRQLRGRAGRQGDPGSSQFFVSLEDDLMRLFGSDRIAKLMDRMGLKEGEVIQHSMISKSIERAQKKVEENNFGIRKRLLEYDDVMNAQRTVIYKKRRHALDGERLGVDIANSMYDVCVSIVDEYY
ncbi:MAG: preprotein translocase subunit SecA, partial [Bacteroidales bacterium]|nr:preprotein translocase subunit SecA [Bacteroidales bacterium]